MACGKAMGIFSPRRCSDITYKHLRDGWISVNSAEDAGLKTMWHIHTYVYAMLYGLRAEQVLSSRQIKRLFLPPSDKYKGAFSAEGTVSCWSSSRALI